MHVSESCASVLNVLATQWEHVSNILGTHCHKVCVRCASVLNVLATQ
jgi:hypothetical protein